MSFEPEFNTLTEELENPFLSDDEKADLCQNYFNTAGYNININKLNTLLNFFEEKFLLIMAYRHNNIASAAQFTSDLIRSNYISQNQKEQLYCSMLLNGMVNETLQNFEQNVSYFTLQGKINAFNLYLKNPSSQVITLDWFNREVQNLILGASEEDLIFNANSGQNNSSFALGDFLKVTSKLLYTIAARNAMHSGYKESLPKALEFLDSLIRTGLNKAENSGIEIPLDKSLFQIIEQNFKNVDFQKSVIMNFIIHDKRNHNYEFLLQEIRKTNLRISNQEIATAFYKNPLNIHVAIPLQHVEEILQSECSKELKVNVLKGFFGEANLPDNIFDELLIDPESKSNSIRILSSLLQIEAFTQDQIKQLFDYYLSNGGNIDKQQIVQIINNANSIARAVELFEIFCQTKEINLSQTFTEVFPDIEKKEEFYKKILEKDKFRETFIGLKSNTDSFKEYLKLECLETFIKKEKSFVSLKKVVEWVTSFENYEDLEEELGDVFKALYKRDHNIAPQEFNLDNLLRIFTIFEGNYFRDLSKELALYISKIAAEKNIKLLTPDFFDKIRKLLPQNLQKEITQDFIAVAKNHILDDLIVNISKAQLPLVKKDILEALSESEFSKISKEKLIDYLNSDELEESEKAIIFSKILSSSTHKIKEVFENIQNENLPFKLTLFSLKQKSGNRKLCDEYFSYKSNDANLEELSQIMNLYYGAAFDFIKNIPVTLSDISNTKVFDGELEKKKMIFLAIVNDSQSNETLSSIETHSKCFLMQDQVDILDEYLRNNNSKTTLSDLSKYVASLKPDGKSLERIYDNFLRKNSKIDLDDIINFNLLFVSNPQLRSSLLKINERLWNETHEIFDIDDLIDKATTIENEEEKISVITAIIASYEMYISYDTLVSIMADKDLKEIATRKEIVEGFYQNHFNSHARLTFEELVELVNSNNKPEYKFGLIKGFFANKNNQISTYDINLEEIQNKELRQLAAIEMVSQIGSDKIIEKEYQNFPDDKKYHKKLISTLLDFYSKEDNQSFPQDSNYFNKLQEELMNRHRKNPIANIDKMCDKFGIDKSMVEIPQNSPQPNSNHKLSLNTNTINLEH